MIERRKQMEEIVDFVSRNRNSFATHAVCSRILGDRYIGIGENTINDLKAMLPQTSDDELEACYYIIK